MKEKLSNQDEVLHSAQSGDEKALEVLLNHHMPLVHCLLKRYRIKKDEQEDLLSCATLGLIKAIKNFKPEFGFEFSTYAFPVILGEIRKYFRDGRLLYLTRSTQENYKKILQVENSFKSSPSLEEISLKTGLSKEDVLEALESHVTLTSLDAPLDEESGLTILDTIATETEDYFDLKEAISLLPKKDQLFIEMRYFQGKSQKELAERFFMSQVQISRYEKKILLLLKQNILKTSSHTKV